MKRKENGRGREGGREGGRDDGREGLIRMNVEHRQTPQNMHYRS